MKFFLMNFKKGYYYLFYKFYKFGEWSPSSFSSDFTAALAISVLEVFLLISLKFYYIEFFNQDDEFKFVTFQTLAPLLSVILINYFAFIHDYKWEKYVTQFDKLPKNRNLSGTWITIFLVILIIGNLAYAFHMMSIVTGIN